MAADALLTLPPEIFYDSTADKLGKPSTMLKHDQENKRGRALPTVTVIAARCPTCDCTKHKSYRSLDNGDGSRMKWTRCKSCGQKFRINIE